MLQVRSTWSFQVNGEKSREGVPLPLTAFILVGNATVSVRWRIRARHAAVTMATGANRRRPTMVATRGMDGLLIF